MTKTSSLFQGKARAQRQGNRKQEMTRKADRKKRIRSRGEMSNISADRQKAHKKN